MKGILFDFSLILMHKTHRNRSITYNVLDKLRRISVSKPVKDLAIINIWQRYFSELTEHVKDNKFPVNLE